MVPSHRASNLYAILLCPPEAGALISILGAQINEMGDIHVPTLGHAPAMNKSTIFDKQSPLRYV